MTNEDSAASILHKFSEISLELLVGTVTFSLVVAIFAVGIEEFFRPTFQSKILKDWFERTFLRSASPSFDDGTAEEWEHWRQTFKFEDLDLDRWNYGALPPDELCALVARRIQTTLDDYIEQARREGGAPAESHIATLNRDQLEYQMENDIDLLQGRLIRETAKRKYAYSIIISFSLSLILFGFISDWFRTLPGVAGSYFPAAFASIGAFMAPVIQSVLSRLLRGR